MDNLAETVTVSGTSYVISGILFGSGPAWEMIERDDQQLTEQQFMTLPASDRDVLFAHVQSYIAKLNNG